MAIVGTIGVNVVANTARFEAGIRRTREEAKAAGVALRAMGAAAGVAVVAGFTKAARAVEGYNQAMRSSQAIMGDLSVSTRELMGKAAIQVALDTKFSATEAAQAYFYLASAGFNAEQSIASLSTVATFAQAGMFDLALATDLLTDAQSALGLTAEDAAINMENMAKVGDVLVKANAISNATTEQFSQALTTKVGGALKFTNKDIEEGVALLAALADQGVKGAQAGTQLNIVLRELRTKAERNADAFREHGVAVYDFRGNVRNTADIIGDFEKALEGMSDKAKTAMLSAMGFSDRSSAALLLLLGTSDKIRKYEEELRNAGGTMQEVADKQLTAMAEGWSKVKAATVAIMAVAITPFLDAIGSALTFVVESLRGTNGAFAKVVVTTAAAVSVFTAVAVAIPLVSAAVVILVGWLKRLAIGQAIVLALSGPKGWLTLGLALGAAAASVITINKAFKGTEEKAKAASNATTELTEEQNVLEVATMGVSAAMENSAEAIKAATAAKQELMRQGEQLTESLRTPTEIFRDSLQSFQKLFRSGAITAQTYGRAVRRAAGELRDATDQQVAFNNARTPRIAAAQYGTSSGSSAVLDAQSAARDAQEANRQRNIQIELDRQRNQQIERLIEQSRNGDRFEIGIANL